MKFIVCKLALTEIRVPWHANFTVVVQCLVHSWTAFECTPGRLSSFRMTAPGVRGISSRYSLTFENTGKQEEKKLEHNLLIRRLSDLRLL